ncbi:weak acid resistance [Conoideocrella luteorostrata]|uniref:Weak acid resistance n=1 Tax=Conoideocrella luteorostrata TaxID=1105319 RepID=A0AAJ0FPM9_9HYPO|nr:weak acid resistance [Conoideocrella luteorostrata]
MSFFKFKLDNVPPRSALVPIASQTQALSSPSSSTPGSGSGSGNGGEIQHGTSSTRPLPAGSSFQRPYIVQPPQGTGNPRSRDGGFPSNEGRAGKRAAEEPTTRFITSTPRSRKQTKTRRSTSCTECRLSKTRCERSSSVPGDACHRCLRLGKHCLFDAIPSPPSTVVKPPASRWQSGALDLVRDRKEDTSGTGRNMEAEASSAFFAAVPNHSPRPLPSIENKQLDIKIDSLIGRDVAQRVFRHYISHFVPKCPMVIFTPGITAEAVRETRPLLFLSILSVSANEYCTAGEQKELVLEAKQALAERAFVRGEKSLELVQALQVVSLWYRAPDDYKQVNLTQLSQIAITMAIDLGLDKIDVSQPVDTSLAAWDRAEAQRAWLGCFLLTTSISLVLRRVQMISWTSDMNIYMTDLQRTQLSPSDAFFCELVKMERLSYAMDETLSLSDSASSASIYDPATMRTIQDFQARIDGWTSFNLDPLQKFLVNFGKFTGSLYAHEPAMHVNGNVSEFAAPFTSKSLQACSFINEKTEAVQLLMLRKIMTASHGLLDVFLGLPLLDMLTLSPHIYGGRVIYSVILLCKLYKTITSSRRDVTDYISTDELFLEHYLERLVIVAKDLVMKDERNALSRSFAIFEQLKKWFHLNGYQQLPADELATGSSRRSNNRQHDAMQTSSGSRVLLHPYSGTAALPGSQPEQAPSSTSPVSRLPPADTDSGQDWFWEDLFHVDMFN